MLKVSPKGTVPILVLDDEVIDQSNDIIEWVLSRKNIFQKDSDSNTKTLTEDLITIFDDKFKYHLDRYKYSTRYENVDIEFHRLECLKILIELEKHITSDSTDWIFNDIPSKLDICILSLIHISEPTRP